MARQRRKLGDKQRRAKWSQPADERELGPACLDQQSSNLCRILEFDERFGRGTPFFFSSGTIALQGRRCSSFALDEREEDPRQHPILFKEF